jgi:uncharacterized protein YdbL (DUF1318 family)
MNRKNLLIGAIVGVVGLSVLTGAWAASYDIKEMTPEVKAALDGRRSRFEDLKSLKAQGAIGENNRGYVEVLKSEGNAQSTADAENRDRRFIYTTIVAQNELPQSAIGTVEAVFAQVQRDKAGSGDKVQDASGSWTTK